MMQPPRDCAPHAQTQAALDAMRAYFTATAQAQPRRERERLEREWLAAVRRLRIAIQ